MATAKIEFKPEVVKTGIFDMQVCVPSDWSDKQVLNFANGQNYCGTSNGWMIRKEGDKALLGCPERVQCDTREDFVHIMLDA